MSDLRSVLPSAENKPFHPSATLVNTNAVLQKALQKLPSEARSKIVLRCDDLPFFPGPEDDIEHVFTALLNMIQEKKEDVAKLFLHISCASEEGKLTATGFFCYLIQFHSNILPSADWYQRHEQQISAATAILQKHKGSLVVNQMKNGGCIFSVSLPGKTL